MFCLFDIQSSCFNIVWFQGPSASAYVTYNKTEDALKAIIAVNNVHIDGRTLKASLGTTKYCSHFLRGTQCPKTVSLWNLKFFPFSVASFCCRQGLPGCDKSCDLVGVPTMNLTIDSHSW